MMQNYSDVTQIGVDETSSKRGHNYISIFVDMAKSKVLFATEGKGAETLSAFKQDLIAHKGKQEQIKDVCCDMSPAFIAGTEKTFPSAEITFDKFHVLKIINEAVDEVRRQEQKDCPVLKKTRFIWLKNANGRTQKEEVTYRKLKDLNLKTIRAFHVKLNFQEFYNQPQETAEDFLKSWYFWATHSRLQPIIDAAKTIKRHWTGVLRWFKSKITNGVLEEKIDAKG
ncbi:MAG: ISL3 family transposase [Deltaproteobacteria bacterium]|nr:ISL3 family transposase [Deltaproteobacteria bacterium]